MPTNQLAIVLPSAKAPIEIKEVPVPVPNDGEVLIKNVAIGLNPVDAKIARNAIFPLQYPVILGLTVAGIIQESKNPRFAVGDRVMASLPWQSAGDNRNGAYQQYSIAAAPGILKIPDHLSFERASAFPMTATVAAGALFSDSGLGLEKPKDWRNPTPKDQTVLIWGGSTSVGGYAVQFATMAGYKVVTTASPHNYDYVNSLAPVTVYNHSDSTAPAAIAAHGPFVGIIDNAGVPASHKAILEVLKLTCAPNPPSGTIKSLLPVMAKYPNWPEEVKVPQFTYRLFIPEHSEFAEWLWGESGFLHTLLQEEGLKETPVEIIGGFEAVDKALDRMLEGVSAKKLVVKLE